MHVCVSTSKISKSYGLLCVVLKSHLYFHFDINLLQYSHKMQHKLPIIKFIPAGLDYRRTCSFHICDEIRYQEICSVLLLKLLDLSFMASWLRGEFDLLSCFVLFCFVFFQLRTKIWVSAFRSRFLGNETSGFNICRCKLRTKQVLLLTTELKLRRQKRIIASA